MIVKCMYRLFQKDDYSIIKVRVLSGGEEYGDGFAEGATVSIAGYYLPDGRIDVTGNPEHNKYGWTLKVLTCAPSPDLSPSETVSYLRGLAIPGLGMMTARKIVRSFKDPIETIKNEPDKVAQLFGVSEEKAQRFSKELRTQTAFSTALSLLYPLGFSASVCKRIAELFKENVGEVIKRKPYVLCNVRGCKFADVDQIGKKYGIPENDPERLKAAMLNVLVVNEGRGNTTMTLSSFSDAVKALLKDVSNADLAAAFKQLAESKKVYQSKKDGTSMISKALMYEKESLLATKIARMSSHYTYSVKNATQKVIAAASSHGLSLHENQIKAAATAIDSPLTVITGGPGTGKTSVLLCLCDAFSTTFPEKKITLLSPTGKAARRMREQTGRYASTIHSAMKILPDDPPDKEYELEGDLIIIDEASMLDLLLAEKVFNSIEDGAHIVLVGDIDQLPSVGAGSVLHDLISSEACPVVRLTKIFRQSSDSAIITMAHKVRNGDTSLSAGPDFRFVQALGPENIAAACEQYYINAGDDVVCLCPNRKGEAGVYNMNKRLQKALNPDGQDFYGIRIGDPVMQLVNDSKTGVSNGDVGIARDICDDGDGPYLRVAFFEDSDSPVYKEYYKPDLEECMLAYSMTVHKSQGSEYKTVLCPMGLENKSMLKRNLLYTGITRGKKMVYLIGEPAAFKKAIETSDTFKRKTLLQEKIKAAKEKELTVIPFIQKRA